MLYFPLLRTKQGELTALTELQLSTKQAVRPVLQVPPPDLAFNGDPVPPDEAYAQKVAKALRPVLAFDSQLNCFLDPSTASLPAELIHELLVAVAEHGGNPEPVYRLMGSEQHARMQSAIFGPPHNAILRVGIGELSLNPAAQVTDAMQRYQLRPDQTLVMLDMGDISSAAIPLRLYEQSFCNAIKDLIPLEMAGLIVASCALPAKGELPKWQWSEFPRHEADVFRHIREAVNTELHFGDYAVGNVIAEPSVSRPGAPKVRYTTPTSYLVMKGQQQGTPPNTMSEQYQRLSEHVVGHDEYKGYTFSWGDDHINRASKPGSQSRGNAATWVTVHTTHHIELVGSLLDSM